MWYSKRVFTSVWTLLRMKGDIRASLSLMRSKWAAYKGKDARNSVSPAFEGMRGWLGIVRLAEEETG